MLIKECVFGMTVEKRVKCEEIVISGEDRHGLVSEIGFFLFDNESEALRPGFWNFGE